MSNSSPRPAIVKPPVWMRTWRSVTRSFPAPQPATYSATGSSRPSWPRSHKWRTAVVVTGFPDEYHIITSSRSRARPGADSPMATSRSGSPKRET